jgi:cytochrome c553
VLAVAVLAGSLALSNVCLAQGGTAGAAAAQPAEIKGDAQRAKQFKISMCIGCHGIEDYRTAYPVVYSVPKIAGQNPGYITAALKEYRSGERSHPTMRGVAASLSDQDIADVAAYYGGAKRQ